jgi:hypothetical protein
MLTTAVSIFIHYHKNTAPYSISLKWLASVMSLPPHFDLVVYLGEHSIDV